MINNCVLMGTVKNFFIKNDKLIIMIKHTNADGDFVIPITTFIPKDNILEYLENDLYIGIKGHVTLNEESNIEIVAEKISFISSKKKENDDNESK